MNQLKPAVKALIEKDGEILTLKIETEKSHYWVLPGGKIEYGEEPEEALEREIQEEISCEPSIRNPVGMYHFFVGPENEGDQVVLTVFEAELDSYEIDIDNNPADENITEYRWLPPEELIERSSNESLQRLVKDYSNDLPKLVRDRIPEIIRDNDDGEPVNRELDDSEVMPYLREKLVEEAEEFQKSGKLEELGDVREVLDRILELVDKEEVERLKEKKARDRGRFDSNIALKDIDQV